MEDTLLATAPSWSLLLEPLLLAVLLVALLGVGQQLVTGSILGNLLRDSPVALATDSGSVGKSRITSAIILFGPEAESAEFNASLSSCSLGCG